MDTQINTLIGEEFIISPQFCVNPIPAKITLAQSQGSEGYVANMDAQIILSNNIATFSACQSFQVVMVASNPSSKNFKHMSLINNKHATKYN
jgi:hypothetical protein